jgi:hypothetical protein
MTYPQGGSVQGRGRLFSAQGVDRDIYQLIARTGSNSLNQCMNTRFSMDDYAHWTISEIRAMAQKWVFSDDL